MSHRGHRDRRAYEQEWASRRHTSSVFAPIGDPTASAFQINKDAARQANLLRGIVVDAIPFLHAYRVHFENRAPTLICTMGTQTSLGPIGAKEINTLVAGTPVWVAWTPQLTFGVIVCVEPYAAVDPALLLCDWYSASSFCGFKVDKAWEAVLRTTNSGNLTNWCAGRPIDSVPVGEWGAITETGLKVTLDPFMIQVAGDEATGLFVFYHDQLVRLAGMNLESFSAGHVEQTGDDQGEIRMYRGWTPYPWEQLGSLKFGTDPSLVISPDDSQNKKAYYASLEPKNNDQIPFHRRVQLGGYIGQAGKDLVVAPPASVTGNLLENSTINTPTTLPTGVLEEQRTLPGMYMVRSAKGLHILKQPAIPVPHAIHSPEDLSGDNPNNYRYAGKGTGGLPHTVAAAIKTNASHAGLQRVAGIQDELAMRRNWEGEHALFYHQKDWFLPEEQDSPLVVGLVPPPLDTLKDKFVLPEPPSVNLKIDDRYGNVAYYLNEAGLHFMDDGAIIMRDGFGSQLVMGYGNIELQPAADLQVKAGRSVVQWAGRDIISRAKNCVDISASTADVRLKAEKNMHMLAGNSGKGGLLLESRGNDAVDYVNKVGTDVTSGGIQLKATAGSIFGWANNYYLRALNGGSIFLDADQGNGTLYSIASTATRYCTAGAFDYFGPPGAVTASNVYGPGENQMGASLSVNGAMTANLGLVLKGDINVVGGHIYTEEAKNFGGQVGDFGTPPTAAAVFKDEIQGEQKAMKLNNTSASKQYSGILTTLWYKGTAPGNAKVIASAGFSFRTTTQYGAGDYVCWETSWQQVLREAKIKTDLWTEPAVTTGPVKTMPYPGLDRLSTNPVYYQQKLNLFDMTKGVAKSRSANRAAYETPSFATVTPIKLDGNYPIISIPTPPKTTTPTPTPTGT